MADRFTRIRMLAGDDGMEKMKSARAAVFGIGGVGGYAAEALVRSGIGEIDLFDNDTVSVTNINRQIIATEETVGRYKVDVMRERALAINPDIKINAHNCFYMPDNAEDYDLSVYSYIIDAVDVVTAKIELIVRAQNAGVPIISCMGTGNKLNPAMLEVADIYDTSVCPLARVMRRELKKRGIKKLKVVYSREEPIRPDAEQNDEMNDARRAVPGSTAFVPAAAGLIAASEVVREIIRM